jgi:hypothetical protein
MPQRPPNDQSRAIFPGWDIDVVATLRQLRDQDAGDSPQATMLRIIWLRQAFPNASIATEPIRIEPDLVVIQATVTVPDGAASSGIAAELASDHDSLAIAVEYAETRAIGRALDVLGLILPPQNDARPRAVPDPIRTREPVPVPDREPERPRPHPEPVMSGNDEDDDEDVPPPVVDALRRAARTSQPGSPPQPRSIRPVDAGEESGPPDQPAPRQQQQSGDVRFTVPTPFPQRPASPESDNDDATGDPPLEDYSWTAFWRWAREKGMMRKIDIEQRIGKSVDNMNPAEIRLALSEAGVDIS